MRGKRRGIPDAVSVKRQPGRIVEQEVRRSHRAGVEQDCVSLAVRILVKILMNS